MVALAWFGLVGSWFISFIGGWWINARGIGGILSARSAAAAAQAFDTAIDQAYVLEVLTASMVAAGAIFLVLVMLRIERRSAARDREIRDAVLGTRSGTPA
jgi:hypothetical protein